jgi:cephalosporin-C deacetylase-like acetyl esterase
LFGNYDDDLHWKKAVHDVEGFRQGLLQSINMTEVEWKTYRKTIKDYRDKDVAHIEVRPLSQVPQSATALRATTYYYSVALEELSGFRDYSKWPNNLDEYYQKSLEQAKTIVSIAYSATSSLEEKVN